MLTKFHPQSSFKKKFTVIVIWLVALVMMAGMVKFISESKMALIWSIPLVIAELFIVLGILLRCKIARWFTLLTVYTLFFSPFVGYLMVGEAVSPVTIISYMVLLITVVYVFSNKKAMELFYIDSNPTEHLPLILLALTINSVYIYAFRVI
jgi:hypothetical protein